jgi:uncharacterized protein
MNADLTLPLAFLAGLAGAGHCWAMCGGLAGGVFLACAGPHRARPHLLYHGGRVLAYTLLGALAAGIGQALVLTGGIGRAQGVLYVVAGVGVVLAGVLAMRGSPGCTARTDSLVPPMVRAAHPGFPALAGFLNGLMPCALVFSLTLKAATAPSIAMGAAWLFAFGLGTVPAMGLAGVLAHWLGVQSLAWLRRAGGLLVIVLGLQAIWAGAKFFQVMLQL